MDDVQFGSGLDSGASVPQSGGFGLFMKSFGFGTGYTAPDPQMSPLDQSADLLQQRVRRASNIATNPLAQIFAPEQVQAARDFVPKATEQFQTIQKQKADIAAGRQHGQNLGLAPGEVSDYATREDRVIAAQSRALKGDLNAFQGLQAYDPKAAEAIQDQVHSAVAAHLNSAQGAFEKLSNARNQGEYAAALKEIRKGGTVAGLESLGLKIPDTFGAFDTMKGREAEAIRNARIGVDTIRQKLEDRNTYQPMEEKEAKTYSGRITTAFGDQITNGTWSRNSAAGTRGLVVNGAGNPRDLGKNFTFASPEQRKAIKEEFDGAVPKEDMEKFRAFNRTYDLATKDSKGNIIPAEGVKNAKGELMYVNTNPNVQQGVAEGLASMLRGGSGGANVGLLKIELAKRGWAQGAIDNLVSNVAGTVNTMFRDAKDEGKPYLSQRTQKQIRDVMDALNETNGSMIRDRTAQIAKRAGALGLDSVAFGFGKNESGGAIGDAMEEGRQAQIKRMTPFHQAIGSGDGVFQIGAQRPGAGAVGAPAGTQPATQLPGAAPLRTPVQQALAPGVAAGLPLSSGGQPPLGAGIVAPGPGGGGPIASVAGKFGIDPDNLTKMVGIESGGNPRAQTGSYKGLLQLSNAEFEKYKPRSDASIWNAQDNLEAGAAKMKAEGDIFAKRTGREPTPFDTYMIHQQGVGGYPAQLARPEAPAWMNMASTGEGKAKGDMWAKKAIWDNVPDAYKATFGKVENVTGGDFIEMWRQRFEREGRGDRSAPNVAGTETGPEGAAYGGTRTGRIAPGRVNNATDDTTWGDVRRGVVEHAPAIGSTLGAIGGTMMAPGLGTVAGGGVGGAAGQSLKDYLRGNPQNLLRIGKEGALGAVLGVVPEGRPVVGAAARMLGVGGVEGGAKALEGGDVEDVATAAATGTAGAIGGETLGRFVSSVGREAYKAISRYTAPAQQELMKSAGKLAEAQAVLKTEQPKLPGDAGPNPKYEAAKKQADEATAAIKDHNQNPDDMVHAYEQAAAGVSAGEAAVLRKAESNKAATSAGYRELEQAAREGGGAYRPGLRRGTRTSELHEDVLSNGPLSTTRTAENLGGKVEEKFLPDAQHAERLTRAPAKDWGEKWGQLQDAGSELIKKRLTFLKTGDQPSADAMDEIFKGVRNQQKAAANYVFGPKKGPEAIARLESLDKSWAEIMTATAGMDYGKMRSIVQAGNTPERRALEKSFRAFAGDDSSAMRAFSAMKAGAHGRITEETKLLLPLLVGEAAGTVSGIAPTFGAVTTLVAGHRVYKIMQEYMNAKLLGRAVKFGDFLAHDIQTRGAAGNIAGQVGARAAVSATQ